MLGAGVGDSAAPPTLPQQSCCLPSPKARAVKEMTSMALGFNCDAAGRGYL